MSRPVLTATFRIVTPMFLGGAGHEVDPGSIRMPAIKGALRFWWRALHWGRMVADHPNDRNQALQELHRREAFLFGIAADETGAGGRRGQGLLLPRVTMIKPLPQVIHNWPPSKPNDPGAYLGFGVVASGRGITARPHRQALSEGGRFEVRFLVRPAPRTGSSPYDRQEMLDGFVDALRLFGLLGGLGARARKGLGSVALLTLNGEKQDLEPAAHARALNDLLKKYPRQPDLPPFTAFSDQARIVRVGNTGEARQAILLLERHYKACRKSEENRAVARRYPFGLPLNMDDPRKADTKNRRASPLFMHVHPTGKTFSAFILYLPARFHPDPRYAAGDEIAFFQPLADFISGPGMEAIHP